MKRLFTTFVGIVIICGYGLSSNTLSIKTNLLYDALLNANIGAELQVAPRWSLDLSGNYNGWTLGNGKKWKHWLVQPEARFWLKEATRGHFFAAHLFGGQYNITPPPQ